MLKKICSFLALACAAFALQADTEIVGGVEWTYDVTNGEATISYADDLVGHADFPGSLGGCPVVGIDDQAFVYNQNLVSVTLPASLRSIGYAAFGGCTSLKYVTFLGDEADVAIGEYAFADTPYENGWMVPFLIVSSNAVTGISWQLEHDDCGCLTNGCVLIPPGIASVRAHALEDFDGLETVVIPASVESVGDFALAWCSDLDDVVFVGTNTTTCSRTAFCGTPWKLRTEGWNLPFVQAPGSGGVLDIRYSTVTEPTSCAVTNGVLCIPEGVTTVPSALFEKVCDVKLTTIVCPTTLKSVATEGLVSCPYLQLVELRSTDIRIASDAFGSDEETVCRVGFALNAGSEVLRGWNLALSGTTPSVFPYTYSGGESYRAFLVGPGYDALPLTAELTVGPGKISEFEVPDVCTAGALKAVIAGVSGATWNDFRDCPYQGNGYDEVTSCRCLTCPAIVDVEKTAAKDADDYACYYLPQINMAYWGGWIPKDEYPSEDAVADVFRGRGSFSDIVGWVSANCDPDVAAAVVSGPTSSVVRAFNEFIVDNLSDGKALVMLGTYNSSHGITCCGYACDETKKVTDAGYLRGLFIVDSDNDMNNNGGGAAAPNRITYCELDESNPDNPPMIADIWGLSWDYAFAERALRAKSGPVTLLHTVTFDLGDHGSATGGVALVQVVTNGCAAVAPGVVADVGWMFLGWDRRFGDVTEDLTVRAIYEELPSRVETEVVDGVEWTFVVSGDKASVGGGSFRLTAVPTSTAGTTKVPTSLGGYAVTGLGKSAFENCRNLESVVIPDGVTVLGGGTFRACAGLKSVALPASLRSVGMLAFCGCKGLGQVDLKGVTTVGVQAFSCCNGLTNVIFDATLTKLGADAFEKCRALAAVRFAGDVPEGLADSGLIGTSALIYYPSAYAANYERIVPADQRGVSVGSTTTMLKAVRNGKDVEVSNTWAGSDLEKRFGIGKAAKFAARYGSDLATALFRPTGKVASDGTSMTVLDDYVAGTDPTDASSRLQANVAVGADGVPHVTWTPDLNEAGQKSERVYRIYGAKDLNGDWSEVKDGQSTDSRFFKVTVELP